MKKFKKLIAGIVTMAMSVSLTTAMPLSSSAADTLVYLGDANDDGMITGVDAMCIEKFILGMIKVTNKQFTAMDVNEDEVVDESDAKAIINAIGTANTGKFKKVSKPLYRLPDNSNTTYRKHSCASSSSNSYSTYTISAATALPDSVGDEPALCASVGNEDIPAHEKTACVELEMTDYNGNISYGSGFIVANNVIATSANCLYGDSGFMKNITATVYDYSGSSGTPKIYKTSAKSIHIPDDYYNNGDINENYNYGLIYFDKFIRKNSTEELILSKSKGSIEELGIASNAFFDDSTKKLSTVGFTHYGNDESDRYVSDGNVIPMSSGILYRFHSSSSAQDSKRGGMTYTMTEYDEYTASGSILKPSRDTTVGIATSGDSNNTYGVRLDTSILRFYLQNNNLS